MNPVYVIDHWSYSSLKTFLRNRFAFKKQYILKIFDQKISPSMLVGKACHKALETILKGGTVEAGIEAGLVMMQKEHDDKIDWGKTGSREKAIKAFTQGVNFYLADVDIAKLKAQAVGVEKVIVKFIEEGGVKRALPIKAVIDVVIRKENGRLRIIDHKFVTSYTDSTEEKGDLILQAMFYFHAVKAELGEEPEDIAFHECKISKNKDGKPQMQPYVIEFAKHPEHQTLFFNLLDSCTEEIAKPDCNYLPNFSDILDGAETLQAYQAQMIGIKRPRMVEHKTRDTEFSEKQFIPAANDVVDNAHLTEEEKVRMKLQEFGIAVEMQKTLVGMNVIKYTLKPSRGTRMKDFERHAKDLAIALKAKTIRVEAPIMGTDLVGVEVPNPKRTFAAMPNLVESDPLYRGTLNIPIGIDVMGETIIRDLAKMPHLLIAGATGSGKSVMINVAIQALIAQNQPEQVKLVLIDPKRVELSRYKNDPHVMARPIYEIEEANRTLNWLVNEMERRYQVLENAGAINIDAFNEGTMAMEKIVVVIDEFADLMLQGIDKTAETCIVRLSQKSRAVGIHLILGTQRPSVDVISGVIKANLPCRIAFATAQRIDSQVILDVPGAEQLTGKGDMLFLDPTSREIIRIQGFYV